MVEDVAERKVISLHTDISTATNECFIIFTLGARFISMQYRGAGGVLGGIGEFDSKRAVRIESGLS